MIRERLQTLKQAWPETALLVAVIGLLALSIHPVRYERQLEVSNPVAAESVQAASAEYQSVIRTVLAKLVGLYADRSPTGESTGNGQSSWVQVLNSNGGLFLMMMGLLAMITLVLGIFGFSDSQEKSERLKRLATSPKDQ